jgi:plastocyanin
MKCFDRIARGMTRTCLHAASGTALVLALQPIAVAAPPTRTVDIRQFAFVPKDVTVEPGTRIVWTNHDETPHTVTSTSAPKVMASPGLDTDDRFEFVFEREGDFAYLCTVHPMMTGVVHVRRSASR